MLVFPAAIGNQNRICYLKRGCCHDKTKTCVMGFGNGQPPWGGSKENKGTVTEAEGKGTLSYAAVESLTTLLSVIAWETGNVRNKLKHQVEEPSGCSVRHAAWLRTSWNKMSD